MISGLLSVVRTLDLEESWRRWDSRSSCASQGRRFPTLIAKPTHLLDHVGLLTTLSTVLFGFRNRAERLLHRIFSSALGRFRHSIKGTSTIPVVIFWNS